MRRKDKGLKLSHPAGYLLILLRLGSHEAITPSLKVMSESIAEALDLSSDNVDVLLKRGFVPRPLLGCQLLGLTQLLQVAFKFRQTVVLLGQSCRSWAGERRDCGSR